MVMFLEKISLSINIVFHLNIISKLLQHSPINANIHDTGAGVADVIRRLPHGSGEARRAAPGPPLPPPAAPATVNQFLVVLLLHNTIIQLQLLL